MVCHVPLLTDGELNPSLDPSQSCEYSVTAIDVGFFPTGLGVGLNPTPIDVGLSPMLVFPTVLVVGLTPIPCHHRIQRKTYGVPKWPIDLGF